VGVRDRERAERERALAVSLLQRRIQALTAECKELSDAEQPPGSDYRILDVKERIARLERRLADLHAAPLELSQPVDLFNSEHVVLWTYAAPCPGCGTHMEHPQYTPRPQTGHTYRSNGREVLPVQTTEHGIRYSLCAQCRQKEQTARGAQRTRQLQHSLRNGIASPQPIRRTPN